jgi:hypothetical protein
MVKITNWLVLVRPAVASTISDANVLACNFSANNVAKVSGPPDSAAYPNLAPGGDI